MELRVLKFPWAVGSLLSADGFQLSVFGFLRSAEGNYSIAVEFYHLAQRLTLPRHLKDQLDRASSSVVLNLAEGAARETKRDQRRFFSIALGSLRESQAILDITLSSPEAVRECADKLGAHLYRLVQNTRA